MKVIGIENNYMGGDAGNEICDSPSVYLMADTTLLKDGKPFFVPDFSQDITFGVSLVVKISRLGKNIAKRFASRYYEEATVGMTLCANDLKNVNSGGGESLSTSFDGAAIIGSFYPISDLSHMGCVVTDGEGNEYKIDTSEMKLSVDDLIEHISRFYTLKIGDIIFTGFKCRNGKIKIDQSFEGCIGGINALNFRTK